MSELPRLKIAVVGHTNTGKTSLLRTLLRDENFGEVSDRPAVTREVEGSILLIQGKPALELYDTPGLEDSIGLLDHLHSLRGDSRSTGPDILKQFLESQEANRQFSQEAKALRQVLACDAALYVIDARDRVLGKYRDELETLSMCARPVVPVLNFIATAEANASEWREHLAKLNLHAVAEFDTVVLDEHGEQRLLEKMRTLLDPFAPTLDALIEDRIQLRKHLITSSSMSIADLLIDAAAYRLVLPSTSTHGGSRWLGSDPHMTHDSVQAALEKLRSAIRRREQRCVDQLLDLHRFRHEDCDPDQLPIVDGRWGIDLFDPEAMKTFGVRAGGGAAAGAMAGLLVDVLTGGLTAGAGTATGAAIGAALGGHSQGRRLLDKLRGRTELRCDDATLMLLQTRQIALVKALLRRGHAAQHPLHLQQAVGYRLSAVSCRLSAESREPRAESRLAARGLPQPLRIARSQPSWSALDEKAASRSARSEAERSSAAHELAVTIEKHITQ